ncbi:hypothetical protein O6H91_03G036700 [Diphasiastrum complanatum]|uniref:Uncharacterized protein n=1 Tax=Diphasiastrum complanatum TaxID=34168 RepID=A0ACC2E5W7_DIPCM|nr:hypothetical protein O6H91_03G036700 [Diphasiastrum complanatum]
MEVEEQFIPEIYTCHYFTNLMLHSDSDDSDFDFLAQEPRVSLEETINYLGEDEGGPNRVDAMSSSLGVEFREHTSPSFFTFTTKAHHLMYTSIITSTFPMSIEILDVEPNFTAPAHK